MSLSLVGLGGGLHRSLLANLTLNLVETVVTGLSTACPTPCTSFWQRNVLYSLRFGGGKFAMRDNTGIRHGHGVWHLHSTASGSIYEDTFNVVP